MALSRRPGSRFNAAIWPGFVDAMTALLLVLFFVLSIFMIVQFVLRDQVTEKDRELETLGGQIVQLANALGLEQQRTDQLEAEVSELNVSLSDAESIRARQAALIATLTDQRDTQTEQLASFEDQVAGLLAQNRDLSADLERTSDELAGVSQDLSALRDENEQQISANRALNLALAQARSEVDEQAEAARLAAARREALEALVADLEQENAAQAEAISDAEAAQLADAAAAEALRARLQDSSAELTAMSLALEAERARAEETLTLLAAARSARDELQASLAEAEEGRAEALSAAERQAALLAIARDSLSEEEALNEESQRQVALLNQQTTALNQQLRSLQGLLDEAKAAEAAANVRLESLGSDLNTALARVAAEQRARAELEEAERKRLEEEAKNLENYRSEFFGRVREILGDREGIRIVGDRFVFSSEVLFEAGSASLGQQGRAQLGEVADVIQEIRGEIPAEINWILRVDGHTDNIPISGGAFADNWELSQARALSVVRYLINQEGIPADRLSANGFGEFQPVDPANTPEARARNRRIELKFTER
ncbi:peptidoglycan -binding protein [Oceanibium sediminis]|uniref:peptidoglycan -binding protein n=1 Tax=Oceanibium sediminis TaxID=2026339 RepID=UPI000DD3B2B8|nr:peptidoglycan -binding protein [Oceanibium sediminis]